MIELEGIVVVRGGQAILEVPSWGVREGRIHVVEGPNGAGKTTLLLMTHLMVRPDAGLLRFHGREIRPGTRAAADARRAMGLLFQDPVLFDTTVRRNLVVPLRARGLSRHEARARAIEYLEIVGMDELAGRRARTLSGGEIKRVALARLLALHPELLLLDEPGAHMDPEGISVVTDALREYVAGGGTVVYTTPGERLEGLEGEMVRLEGGKIVAATPRMTDPPEKRGEKRA